MSIVAFWALPVSFGLIRNIVCGSGFGGQVTTGRNASYSYYVSYKKFNGKAIHIPCEEVDNQIGEMVQKISIDEHDLPKFRKLYVQEISSKNGNRASNKKDRLERQVKKAGKREEKLVRLYLEDEINESTYTKLRNELVDEKYSVLARLKELEEDAYFKIDRLDRALKVLVNLEEIFEKAKLDDRKHLLSLIFDRIVANDQGIIIRAKMNSPFNYLQELNQ